MSKGDSLDLVLDDSEYIKKEEYRSECTFFDKHKREGSLLSEKILKKILNLNGNGNKISYFCNKNDTRLSSLYIETYCATQEYKDCPVYRQLNNK